MTIKGIYAGEEQSTVSDGGQPLPVTVGRLLDFPDDPVTCMRNLQAKHGAVAALEEAGQRIHFVFGPEYNHLVLSDGQRFHSRFFAIRGGKSSSQRRLTSGLLSMNGEQHKRNRRLVMDAFQKKAIVGYVPTVQAMTETMLRDWRAGQERDICRDMTEYMLKLTSALLFGVDNPDLAVRIGHMVDHWVHMNHEVGMGAFVSSPEISDRYQDLMRFASDLEVELQELIAARRAQQDGNDALSLMLRAHDEQGSISDDELVGQAALMFAAAHLTTAHTLTWTLFLLAQHPSVMQELHTELQGLGGRTPTPDEAERLPVLERVIKESMRVLPASAYSQRTAAEAVQLGPFQLSPGSAVIFSQFITHHLPELYPDPNAFIPDRWRTINPSPYAYLPFGAGPRMCIGAPLAWTILRNVLPVVLQRFKVTAVPYSEVSSKVISTMLGPTTPVYLRLDQQDGRFQSQPVRGNIETLVELRELPKSARRAA